MKLETWLFPILVWALLGGYTSESASAAEFDLAASWTYFADTTQVHPRKRTLIAPVVGSMSLVQCWVRASVVRGARGWTQPPDVRSGAKMIVTLEALSGSEAVRLGRAKVVAEIPDCCSNQRIAERAFTDPSGPANTEWTPPFVVTEILPLEVSPGDLLQASFKFRKAGSLEGEATHWDRLRLGFGCSTCGTVDSPCPLE